MPDTESSEERKVRDEAEIFSDLQTLCGSSGYIHAIAYFCWRDSTIRYRGKQVLPDDLQHQYSHDKLCRTEISTLIGLMVQRDVDFTVPRPDALQTYVEQTEALLLELHHALTRPWFQGWDTQSGTIPDDDPFQNGASIREPIFYGGESAYNFQYRDLCAPKYGADNGWLQTKKGFQIEDASVICETIGKLQLARQLECAQSLKDKPPETWTMLPSFAFTTEDVVEASGLSRERAQRFLDAFSLGLENRNPTFTALNEFNATNSTPIIKVADNSYILLQPYSLFEAVYETPFYWMAGDNSYSATANKNRGQFLEEFVASSFASIFGLKHVFRNIDIYKGKNRVAELDSLVIYGDRAIVAQAKSKRLTIEARKGNDLQLKDDFKKAIQDANDQAWVCAEALTSDGYRFVSSSGTEIKFGAKPRIVFPICVVSDHYPALAFQVRQFLKSKTSNSIQPPLVVDVFTLDVLAELLNSPLHFLNYLSLRARFGEKLIVSREIETLGFHLKYNLWLDGEHNLVNLGEDFSIDVDIAMMARRAGVPGEKTPKGTLTRFDDLTLGRLLNQIEEIAAPELTGLGLLFLQLHSETAKGISVGIDGILRAARRDGRNHDISTAVQSGTSGITIHCNNLPEQNARDWLSTHCEFRKYDAKASAWYGLLLDPITGDIRGALINERDWQPDAKMTAAMMSWNRKPPVAFSQLTGGFKKIGRNEKCPCGSGRKYKNCCLRA